MINQISKIVDIPSEWENFEICTFDPENEKTTFYCFSKKNPNYQKEKIVFLLENPDYAKLFGVLL